MSKRLVAALVLVAYCLLLIKVMVFKDLPTLRIGQLMLNFAGADGGHPANFVPFTTIVPYLLGRNGLIIAGVNIVGNIILLVPLGFIIPFAYRNITWKMMLPLAVLSGLAIETMQTVLHVGIFDIDDMILNALGVMLGYWACIFLSKWLYEKNYKNIGILAIALIVLAGGALYFVYPWGHPVINPGADFNNPSAQKGDLCGGTGGNGEIKSIQTNSFTMKRNDGSDKIVRVSDHAAINTLAGPGTMSSLKIGDRVTLVGGPNSDGSFTADAVFLCSAPRPETK